MTTRTGNALRDTGDVAHVPPELRREVDDPLENGLGPDGPEDVSDVPDGDPAWVDPEGDAQLDPEEVAR
ncbi:hypothetical protein [Vallicoccus soli]|uniref:hypothetical protein n=1 Tax=Vallicoccus soli TaxID=2339232 RepID=UPI001059BFDF|nr:hypothetical protein [Vallicoccus soli]